MITIRSKLSTWMKANKDVGLRFHVAYYYRNYRSGKWLQYVTPHISVPSLCQKLSHFLIPPPFPWRTLWTILSVYRYCYICPLFRYLDTRLL